MSVRRSSRLKEKEKKAKEVGEARRKKFKRVGGEAIDGEDWSAGSEDEVPSAEEDSGDEVVEGTVVVTKTAPQKSNDYLRVYHSYNRDRGLDLYESEFIDDSELTKETTSSRTKRRPAKRKSLCASDSDQSSSYSSNESGKVAKFKKKCYVSSDEEENGEGGLEKRSQSPCEDPIVVRRRRKKSLAGQLSTSEEETDEDSESQRENRNVKLEEGRKKKRMKFQESDDEEEVPSPVKSPQTVRSRSLRARKLDHDKKLKSAKLLERFKAQRTSDTKSEERNKEEDADELDHSNEFVSAFSSKEKEERQSLADRLLFPSENHDSSDSEDSDWIVSDGEDSYPDMKELLMDTGDFRQPYPLPPGATADEEEGDVILLSEFEPLSPRSLPLHDAVCAVEVGEEGGGREALVEALRQCGEEPSQLNATDFQGLTALMCAASRQDSTSIRLLLEAGASVNGRDDKGTTALHLASLAGSPDCVQLLLASGHKVDSTDEFGWSPILYAHFKKHEDCVLALLKANPHQFSIFGNILKQSSIQSNMEDTRRKKTLKVVRSLLVSLAHTEMYYSIFNDFIADNPAILEGEEFHFMKHCMRLLSFQNKQLWFRHKLAILREHALGNMCPPIRLHNVSRDTLLGDLCTKMKGKSEMSCWKCPFSITFKGEAGICTGPRREFLTCLARSLAQGAGRLFLECDDSKLSLQPCSLFYQHHCHMTQEVRSTHRERLRVVATMLAHAVFHDLTPGLHLSQPLLKQLLNQPLDHPSDLENVDKSLYHGLVNQLLDSTTDAKDLELTFTQTVRCPWTTRTVDVPICEDGRTKDVNDHNKREYVDQISQFKLETSIKEELETFTSSFWKVLPQKCLQIFTPSELALLLSGVPTIDTGDWQRHTSYRGLKESDELVRWLWRLITSLKEEEKALLLQFATGSPCLPVGGFSELKGLGGVVPFTISLIPGMDKIPQASTCFNTLKITEYSSEQELRNKVLIAIRYGCEGFEFS